MITSCTWPLHAVQAHCISGGCAVVVLNEKSLNLVQVPISDLRGLVRFSLLLGAKAHLR